MRVFPRIIIIASAGISLFHVSAVSAIAKRLQENKRQEETKEKMHRLGKDSNAKPRYEPVDSAAAPI